MMKIHSFFVSIILVLLFQRSVSQQLELLHIETLEEVPGLTFPEACTPEDWIVIINSANPDLRFESNILPDTAFKIVHIANQYLICHERSRFILTISGGSLKSEDIRLFDLNRTYAFNITSNIQRGTINVRTSPPNTSIFFPSLNQTHSSERPITFNTGNYAITITKDRFQSLDTIVIFYRDTITNYSFSLKPLFAQIKLNIITEDNIAFKNAPALWINDRRINTEPLIRPPIEPPYKNEVLDFQIYRDNVIPLPQGNHSIKIQAEDYMPFETAFFAENGIITEVPVFLELLYGYITFIDSLNAEGANIFINNVHVGSMPLHRVRTRAGMNNIRVEKPGYMTQIKEFTLNVNQDLNTDFYVTMSPSCILTIESDPDKSEIFLNGTRIGFTSIEHAFTNEFPIGSVLVLKKIKYSDHRQIIDESFFTKSNDTLKVKLHSNHTIKLKSEGRNLFLSIKGLDDLQNIIIDNPNQILDKKTQELRLPHGIYQIETRTTDHDNSYITYKGKYYHQPNKRLRTIPSYSKSSFTFVTADYFDEKNIEASFGRIHIFPKTGLSTSLLSVQYSIFDHYEYSDSLSTYETLTIYPFFLNWDWRLGGSIIRQFDICMLTRVQWSPGLKIVNNLNLFDYNDGNIFTYFYGVELSSRLPAINLNLKIGQQVMNGEIHVWDKQAREYSAPTNPPKISEKDFIVSVGATINFTGVSRSNNMLRIWRKPLVHRALDMFVK